MIAGLVSGFKTASRPVWFICEYSIRQRFEHFEFLQAWVLLGRK
jgi:hypothetical protein